MREIRTILLIQLHYVFILRYTFVIAVKFKIYNIPLTLNLSETTLSVCAAYLMLHVSHDLSNHIEYNRMSYKARMTKEKRMMREKKKETNICYLEKYFLIYPIYH